MKLPPLKKGFYTAFFNNYRRPVSIGIYPEERAAHQELSFSVLLVMQRRGSDDRIEHVVDYDYVKEVIDELATRGHYDLQETLCEAVLDACRQREGVHGVLVRTEKTGIYDTCDGVGCEFADIDPDCLL